MSAKHLKLTTACGLLTVASLIYSGHAFAKEVSKDTDPTACFEKGSDKWALAFYKETLDHGFLFKKLISKFGEPITCTGSENKFEGYDPVTFGVIHVRWKNDLTLTRTIMPIETGIYKVEMKSGFPEKEEIVELIKEHVRTVGWKVDWSKSSKTIEKAESVEEYDDIRPDTNGKIRFFYDVKTKKLVKFTLSIAL